MSNYNSIIQQNNAELEDILDTINALPEGSGGGTGGGVETCTVTINYDTSSTTLVYQAICTKYENGEYITVHPTGNEVDEVYDNVVVGSAFFIISGTTIAPLISTTGSVVCNYQDFLYGGTAYISCITVTGNQGGTITINTPAV